MGHFKTSITTAEATEHYLCIVTIRHAVNEIFETGVFKKKTKKKTNIATRETKVEKPNYFAIFPRTQFVTSSQLVQINIALGAHT